MTDSPDIQCGCLGRSRPFVHFLARKEGIKSMSLTVSTLFAHKKEKRSLKKKNNYSTAAMKNHFKQQSIKKSHAAYSYQPQQQLAPIQNKYRISYEPLFIQSTDKITSQSTNIGFPPYPKTNAPSLFFSPPSTKKETHLELQTRIHPPSEPTFYYRPPQPLKLTFKKPTKHIISCSHKPVKISFLRVEAPSLKEINTLHIPPTPQFYFSNSPQTCFLPLRTTAREEKSFNILGSNIIDNCPTITTIRQSGVQEKKSSASNIKEVESIMDSDSQHSEVLMSGFEEIKKNFNYENGEKKTACTQESHDKVCDFGPGKQPLSTDQRSEKGMKYQMSIGELKRTFN